VQERNGHIMSLKEKAAYLKGLAEGLGLDSESKEGKLLSIIIDTLAEMAEEIEELNENALDIGEELDAISSDLADLEEFVYDDDFLDDDDYDDFMSFDDEDDDFSDYDEADDCDCGFCSGGNFSYEATCPSCGAEIAIDESDLMLESVRCRACGEELEFEFDNEDLNEEEED